MSQAAIKKLLQTFSLLSLLLFTNSALAIPKEDGKNFNAIDPFWYLNGSVIDAEHKSESLRFNNTQEWGKDFERYFGSNTSKLFFKDWEEKFMVPPPPANTSVRTHKELEFLNELQAKRTKADVTQIKREIILEAFMIAPWYSEVTSKKAFPKTRQLVAKLLDDLGFVIMGFKKRFNRVRPSFIDTNISPAIDIPQHAAYPSGHSTQAHTLAYLFSEIRPNRAEQLRKQAWSIARNREIAGVHYPSDSAAGAILARQVVDHLLGMPKFKAMLDEVRAEWDAKGLN